MGIAVSAYGTDLSGLIANRPTNAPAGITYYATDEDGFYVASADGTWVSASSPHLAVTVTSAQLLALFATPVEIVAAPGANKAIIFEGAVIHKPAGTAYAGIAAGEDLTVKYTDASGLQVAYCETTGFLDSVSALTRWVRPQSALTATDSAIVPVANAALVLHLLSGEIITGDSDLILQVHYRVIPTVLT